MKNGDSKKVYKALQKRNCCNVIELPEDLQESTPLESMFKWIIWLKPFDFVLISLALSFDSLSFIFGTMLKTFFIQRIPPESLSL